jgi:hypothetical protein
MERLVRNGLAALVVLAVPVLAGAEERAGSDVSVGYSMLREPEYSGFRATAGWQSRRGLGLDFDYSQHFDRGARLHVFGVGPRLSREVRPGVTVSGHLLLALLVFNLGDGGGGAIGAYPGLSVDFGTDKVVGYRLQGDWPLLVPGGVVSEIPRLSASVVIRPGRR